MGPDLAFKMPEIICAIMPNDSDFFSHFSTAGGEIVANPTFLVENCKCGEITS